MNYMPIAVHIPVFFTKSLILGRKKNTTFSSYHRCMTPKIQILSHLFPLGHRIWEKVLCDNSAF